LKSYVFTFGYETPGQHKSNSRHGWDDEDSIAFFIDAGSEEEAISWGREVAQRFVRELFCRQGETEGYDWVSAGFANWIEEHPEAVYTPEQLAAMTHVRVGEYPELARG
jgi:hypothetical protein